MTGRTRARRGGMWAGAVVSGAIVIAYIAGFWGQVGWQTWNPVSQEHRSIGIGAGVIFASRYDLRGGPSDTAGAAYSRPLVWVAHRPVWTLAWFWRPTLEFRNRVFTVCLPLWIPLIPTLGLTVWLWHRGRGPGPGHCQICRYDLSGNAAGKCPECGACVL